MTIKYKIERPTRFKRDYKIIVKRNYDIKQLEEVVTLLAKGETLPAKYKDHSLKSKYKN